MNDDAAQALAWLCERTDRIRALANRRNESAEADRILTALGDASAADLPPLLEDAAELLRRCGVPGGLRGGPPALPDSQGGHPVEEFYLCPRDADRRCVRLVHAFDVSAASGAEPKCGIAGLPLRLRRI